MSRSIAPTPIAVGGVGGSGTRLLAQVLLQLGVAMPGPLNDALDNLWFTLLFKRQSALVDADEDFAALLNLFLQRLQNIQHTSKKATSLVEGAVRVPRQTHPIDQMKNAAQSLLADTTGPPLASDAPFGWKEPNTHIFLERLLRACPTLRYVHVMRHGVDMALSGNQSQLRLWGPIFQERAALAGPADSLTFWCAVHRRIDRIATSHPGRVLTVKFEDLCQQTEPVVRSIADFLGLTVRQRTLSKIIGDCAAPPSVGRYKSASMDAFCSDDIEYVVSKGYAVD